MSKKINKSKTVRVEGVATKVKVKEFILRDEITE